MDLSSTKDFWIHPNALTITLNYFGDQQLIQTSMLAGAVIMAYKKDYIGYNAAHDFREWKLQAYPTQLSDTCEYFVHAVLSRDGDSAMIVYSPTKRGITGETYNAKGELIDSTSSTDSWYIYLGTISASVDADGVTVDRVWTDGLHTGTLATDQYRMEEAQGDWALMFELVNDSIKVLKTITSATINALTVATNFIFGGKTFTGTAGAEDAGKVNKRNDATLPTTGYVQKEIEALDDHFLIKDGDKAQEVGGDVSFFGEVTANTLKVQRNSTINGHISINKKDDDDDVAIISSNYSDTAGQISGFLLTKSGLLTVGGIKAMSFEIFEVIYNKIRSIGGKLSLSSTGNVESCQFVLKDGLGAITPEEFYADNSTYILADIDYVILKIKEDEVNGGLIPFAHNDILYGYVNKVGESGQHARGGQSCMYVLSTNDDIAASNSANDDSKMTIRCKLFAGDVTDENGRVLYDNENRVIGNMPPTTGMTLAHRGNVNSKYPERMTSFFMDSQSGNIVMLQNVTTPVITSNNYATVLGVLPASLFLEVKDLFTQINEYSPVVYAEYGIFRNLIQFDHQGNPIQRENNRGEWSDNVAEEGGYRNTKEYYDVVTYKGSLYKCVEDKTKQVPGEGEDWLLLVSKGDDGVSSTYYTIRPSVTSIYLRGNTLSTKSLDISVSSSSDEGYKDIDDQNTLDELGLSIWFDIDGDPDTMTMIKLIVGGEHAFELEEGGAVVISESDEDDEEILLTLESSSVDLSKIEDHITIHLIKDADENGVGQVIDQRLIPVTKDGKDGENAIQSNILRNANFEDYEGNGSVLSYWGFNITQTNKVYEHAYGSFNACRFAGTYPDTQLSQTVKLGENQKYVISFAVRQESNNNTIFGVKSNFSDFELEQVGQSHTSTSSEDLGSCFIINTQILDDYEICTFKLKTGSTSDDYTLSFGSLGQYSPQASSRNYVYIACPQLEGGEERTAFSVAAADLVGPAGEAGRSAYPAGYWEEGVEYVRTADTVPFVYYKESNEYFLLKVDSAQGAEMSPTNKDVWETFTKYKAINVEFLMANWAKLGSANGAIFYDKFLFSQDGTDSLGNPDTYGNHQTSMFKNVGTNANPDYRLTGYFVPNLFMDFLNGALKVSRFSEPFMKMSGDLIEIDPYKNHNVLIDLLITQTEDNQYSNVITSRNNFQFRNSLILLPEYSTNGDWCEDGQHFTIMIEHEGALYGRAFGSTTNYAKENIYALVGVDENLKHGLSLDGYANTDPTWNTNLFIWRGFRTKFIMLAPGAMLKLRYHHHQDENGKWQNYWYVENADDFDTIDMDIAVIQDRIAITDKITSSVTALAKIECTHATDPVWNYTDETAGTNAYQPILVGSRVFRDMGRGIVLATGNISDAEDTIPCSRAMTDSEASVFGFTDWK